MAIDVNMKIGEIIQKYPQTVEVMLSHGFHCIGCHVNVFETLEQGAMGHGFSKEQFDGLVKDMNAVLGEEGKKKAAKDLALTAAAAKKLKVLMKGKKEKGLKVEVMPGGCAGSMYELSLEEKGKDGDLVFKDKGVQIFVSKESLEQLKGSEIDFVDSLQGAGFKIINPNASASCGCGNSFR